MKSFKIPKLEKTALISKIQSVLDGGKPWEDKAIHYPANNIIEAVLGIKGIERKESQSTRCAGGFDTNGWDYDWWQYFTYNNKTYVLYGSGYYGGHGFAISED